MAHKLNLLLRAERDVTTLEKRLIEQMARVKFLRMEGHDIGQAQKRLDLFESMLEWAHLYRSMILERCSISIPACSVARGDWECARGRR
jgi:hypothetical protein